MKTMGVQLAAKAEFGAASSTAGEKLLLREVSKSFGSFVAVDRVSLTLREGQLLALLGPSGCGKTTTLRMVAGLEQPTGGQIIVDGSVLADATMSIEPERRKLGMVFQSYALWPHMTVFDTGGRELTGRRVQTLAIRPPSTRMLVPVT